MIPPLGIATLKGFLQKHGYSVKTEDLIVKNECLEFYDSYFKTLGKYVPDEKKGNFNNIGHDILQCHMMAYQNYQDEQEYRELVKILIYKSYYTEVSESCVQELNRIMEKGPPLPEKDSFKKEEIDHWAEALQRSLIV
jgi:hypothetical protein